MISRNAFKRLLCIALVCLSLPVRADTLFEEIGGEAKLKGVVDEFVKVMLDDDRINFAFAGTDLGKFKHLIYTQLCELAGGPCIYDGRDMRTAHAKLNITTAQFNALTEDLYIAFDRAGIGYGVQNKMIALLAPMHGDVVRK